MVILLLLRMVVVACMGKELDVKKKFNEKGVCQEDHCQRI